MDREFLNGLGYPSGMINRHVFSGQHPNSSRSVWIKNAKKINAEDAPVNLLLTAVYDNSSRKLTVKIEGYYTSEVGKESHWLNVVVAENNIIGHQSGGNPVSEYVHNHMLRCFVTPMNEEVYGEEILNPAEGEYFEFNYEIDLPDVNGVQIKGEDIEIIAFVCTGKSEVLNVTGGKPSYVNFAKPLKATLMKPLREIGARYGFDFFEAQLKNLSHRVLTSAKFEVTINGETQESTWTGQIPPYQTGNITITVDSYMLNATNQYSIKLVSLNDQNLDGNSISGSFNAPFETTETIFLEIKTDLHADENRFVIKDRDGNIVHEFGAYEQNLSNVYNEKVTLEKNITYCFEVIDQWWDGILDPRGYFKLRNDDATLIVQALDIKLWGDRTFFYTSKGEDVIIKQNNIKDDINLYNNDLQQTVDISFISHFTEIVKISLYSINGKKLTDTNIQVEAGKNEISIPVSKYGKGVYILKIMQDYKTKTFKVLIKN